MDTRLISFVRCHRETIAICAVSPFQGDNDFEVRQPRALPWVVMHSPYRAKIFMPNRQQNFCIHTSNSSSSENNTTSHFTD
jgi:hypothetical protein